MLPATRERFELFIEKAESLRDLSYIKFFQANQLSYHLEWQRDIGFSNQVQMPDAEALHALATTLRFFTQPRDCIAILLGRNGEKKDTMDEVLDDPGVSQEWKDHYQFVVSELRKKLAGPALPMMRLAIDSQQLTAWNVFETIFYGDIAHANPDKRSTHRLWRSLGPVYPLLSFALHNTIADMVQTISYIYRLCKDEIAGQPIPAFVPPAVSVSADIDDVPASTEPGPLHIEKLTVMDFTDHKSWKPIPEAFIGSNMLGWVCTVLVFDNLKRQDTKGVLVVLVDARDISSPADFDGRQIFVDTYAWTELMPDQDPTTLAIDALREKAGQLVEQSNSVISPDTKFQGQLLPPEHLSSFLAMAVQAYQYSRTKDQPA